MNIEKYLQRINAPSVDTANLQQLTFLQRQHLLQVPFENLDIHLGKKIILDYEAIYKKVIVKRRGGFCYELNGLFYLLLKDIGYSVKRISARVRGDSGRIGAEGDHMAIIATLENKEWLVDVGFGKFSFLPLEIELEKEQSDGRNDYKISKYDETYHGVFVKEENGLWRLGYLFTFEHQETDFFNAMCDYQQTSPDSGFTKRRMITIPKPDGRVTLTNSKLKILKEGEVSEVSVDSDEMFEEYISTHFGMEYEY